MRLPNKDLPAGYRAALRGVAGNLTYTANTVTAWFVEDEVPWPYRSNTECETSLDGLVRAYAALAGRTIHRRISLVNYPVSAWARGLDLDTPEPVNPEAWANYLTSSQRVLYSRPLAEPLAFLGVEVGKRSVVEQARAFRRTPDEVAAAETARLDADLSLVTDGLSDVARPATQREIEWLLHRSVGLGLPAPSAEPHAGNDPLDVGDLAGVFASVDVDPGSAMSRSMRVVAAPGRNGVEAVERHVVVLSVARMETQRIPEDHDPWLARALQHPSHPDVTVRGRVIPGPDAAKQVSKRIDRILDQRRQRLQHGLVIPLALGRVMDQAVRTQDEMQESHRDDATRVETWVRLAVAGSTPVEAMERATELRRHMEAQRIALAVMPAPAEVAAEFIPGEGLATTAHQRRMPVRLFVAAVPQASGSVGDGRGLRLGHTVGGTVQSPVFWDLHAAIEGQDLSGVTPVVGGLGSGKSYLLGSMLALSTLRGDDCTGVDPAGQLAAICRWGPIADHAAALHVLDTAMSPYGVFPKASALDFEDHPDVTKLDGRRERDRRAWELAKAKEEDSKFERRGLVLDMLRGSLPHGVATHPATEQHLMAAVRRNGGEFTSSAAGVIAELGRMRAESNDPHVGVLFDVLSEIGEHPRARHWMAARYEPDHQVVDVGLLMLTMEGLQLPSRSVDPGMWSVSERLSLPLLNLAVHHAYSRVYRAGDRNARKVVAFDEALALDTPLPTPSGWATMGEIQVGDYVVGSDGLPTEVVHATNVMVDQACYDVKFSDGTSMVASGNHKWLTTIAGATQNPPRVRTTQEMHEWASRRSNGRTDAVFQVPRQAALKLPEAELPVDPYALGLWLGDGSKGQSYITATETDAAFYIQELTRLGIPARKWDRGPHKTGGVSMGEPRALKNAIRVKSRLVEAGVWHDKHVPVAFLRGSLDQRLALLQGLMDTDGSVTTGGACVFVNTNRKLINAVVELVQSLGCEARVVWVADDRSRSGGCWHVNFTPFDFCAFLLPRKSQRLSNAQNQRQRLVRGRTIVSITPTDSVPVRCIQVAAADHLFVAGRGWHVTHNCHYLADWASGRALVAKIQRESRRWNIRALLASQDVATTLDAQEAAEALVSDVIGGHVTSEAQQTKLAALLKLHPGFAPTLGTLRGDGWRDFMMRINGRTGRVRFTVGVPELEALLNTTPGRPDTGRGLVLAEAGEWFV